jgi:hypothetical protein
MIPQSAAPLTRGRHREVSRTVMIECRCGRVSESEYDHEQHCRERNEEEAPEPSRKIDLPFKPRFRFPLRTGRKTATSRTGFSGKVGDTFEAYGATFRVEEVSQLPLTTVANDHWREEGVESPEEFRDVWCEIHPRRGWDPDQVVKFIRFKITKPYVDPAQRSIINEDGFTEPVHQRGPSCCLACREELYEYGDGYGHGRGWCKAPTARGTQGET